MPHSYCCDVEGNWQHWENYLSISLVLRREEEGGRLVLRDDCHFVFGGDVCDRGAGDIRVMRDLVELRERYADRVHLIMGNRDVNKLRLRFELADHTLKNSLGNVYWVPKTLSTGNTAPDKLKWVWITYKLHSIFPQSFLTPLLCVRLVSAMVTDAAEHLRLPPHIRATQAGAGAARRVPCDGDQ